MFNMELHVLYTYTRKCVEAKFNFFEKSLPCVQKKHTANSIFAVCQLFAVGYVSRHTAKYAFVMCQTFAVSLFSWHTANRAFAVCPMFCSQQTLWHTANARFPVVIISLAIIFRRTWKVISTGALAPFITYSSSGSMSPSVCFAVHQAKFENI